MGCGCQRLVEASIKRSLPKFMMSSVVDLLKLNVLEPLFPSRGTYMLEPQSIRQFIRFMEGLEDDQK